MSISDSKFEKFKKITKLASYIEADGLKKEFLDSIKVLADQVLKIETKALEKINAETQTEKEELATLRQEFEEVINQAKTDSDNTLAGFKRKTFELINSWFAKNEANQKLTGILNTATQKLQELETKMSMVRDGYDGIDGKDAVVDEEKIVEQVLGKIQLPEKEVGVDEVSGLREELQQLDEKIKKNRGGGVSAIGVQAALRHLSSDAESGQVLMSDGAGEVSWQYDCPIIKYIKATGQAEGDIHLSDATNWAISKSIIHSIRVITSSTDWDLYLLQNDNGYATNDATIPMIQIMEQGNGNQNVYLNLPYTDEDSTSEVHLYYVDNSGSNTADIIIQGIQAK